MTKALTILLIQLAVATVQAQSYERNPSGVFIPRQTIQIAKPTEVAGYSAEWCAKNQEQNSAVVQGCYGRLRLTAERSVRAIVVSLGDGSRRVFFEAKPAAVELSNLSFDIIATNKGMSETGRASVAIDARGEVIGVIAQTPKVGRVQIFRGRSN